MAKIIVDTLGSDLGLSEIVRGAIEARDTDPTLELILVGPTSEIAPLVKGKPIQIVEASDTITNLENPMVAIREKEKASIVVALNILKSDPSIDGMVTAGSTGALICGAILNLKKLSGAKLALLATLIGKGGKPFTLVDCGANIETPPTNKQTKPKNPPPSFLVSFAKMGSAYMQACFGIETPRIGLLSNGAEKTKGDARTKEAHKLLQEANLNFIGNVEASQVLNDQCDCLVCDGFSGNLILKNTEGTAKFILASLLSKKAQATPVEQALLDEVISDLMSQFDYNGLGGAVLLGFDKVLIKGHGASNHTSIKNIIAQSTKMVQGDIINKMIKELQSNN